MRIKKLVLTLLVSSIILLEEQNIKAISINENTSGNNAEFVEGEPCSTENPVDGCSWWSKDFKVRVALVDKENKIVYRKNADGTETSTMSVEFKPYNPYIPGGYGTYEVEASTAGLYDTITGEKFNSMTQLMTPNQEHNIVLLNMYTVNYNHRADLSSEGVQKSQFSKTGYWIYMGFGYCEKDDENCKPAANDFSDYENNRTSFINFIRSYERKIHVEEEGFVGDVSFIDFFLKVCGYTDLWDYTMNEDNLDKLEEYYLVIEPVFTLAVAKNGYWHRYTATAKQLGNFLYHNQDAWRYTNKQDSGWFALFDWFKEPRYNLLCAMYDKGNYTDQNYRFAGGYKFDKYLKDMEYKCLNPNLVDQISSYDTIYYLGWVDSPFGVNILKVVDNSIIPKIINYNSNVSVNSCQNDSFKYELNMTGADDKTIFNSIYPNSIDADKLNDYYYHVGENGNELWCYDNISYDFSDLKNEIGNKTIQAGKIVNLPNGKLKVNRTCYSKSDETKLKGYLEQVFKNDPATYQDTFNFTFGNETYTYKRNTQRYAYKHSTYGIKLDHANKLWYDASSFKINSLANGYKYTSTFYYDYEVDDASKNINSVNINNYSLSETISGTNSIDFLTHFDNAIVVKSQKEKNKTYMNTLSANMNDAYGLSNKLYNKLRNEASTTQDVNGAFTYEGTAKIEKMDTSRNIKYKVNLSYNEIENQSCKIQTTIKDENPMGEGVKFRVISLSNPFPARDGTGRMAGENWVTKTDNNVYDYIQNNRNVNSEAVYQKEPLYTVTLDAQSMIKIREYNKSHSYSDSDITCEEGTGRMCLSGFLRDTTNKYINNLTGTCKDLKADELAKITEKNKEIKYYIENNCAKQNVCEQYDKENDITLFSQNNCDVIIKQCSIVDQSKVSGLDTNNDSIIDNNDYLNTKFYTCADKTAKSGG